MSSAEAATSFTSACCFSTELWISIDADFLTGMVLELVAGPVDDFYFCVTIVYLSAAAVSDSTNSSLTACPTNLRL